MTDLQMEVDVIIVGAGLSGLTAAKVLLDRDPNLHILVLEAKGRVGGRTETVELKGKDGVDRWDLGGQWIGSCQPHIMALVKELKLQTYQQYTTGTKWMQIGKHNTLSSYKSNIPSLSVLGLLDFNRILTKINKLSREIDVTDPFSCPHAELWDSLTLQTFVNKHTWTTEVQDLFHACLRTMFGAELSQLSLLYFLTYVASAGDMMTMIQASENTAQEFKIEGGSQQISIKLMEVIGKSRVVLNEPVKRIDQSASGVTVTTKSGAIYKCLKIILAIPPFEIGNIDFSPSLPVEAREIFKRMPPSNVIKFIVTFPEAFWRLSGFSGEVVTNGGPSDIAGCEKGPLSVVYDATSCQCQPALVGFIGGLQAVQWQNVSVGKLLQADTRKSTVLKSLSQFFGEKVYTYLEYIEKIWDLEPYNEGGPVSCVGPGAMRYYTKGLRHPFNRIHFAGTESATVWCGFMNGAVQAGNRAAMEILYDLRPQLLTVQDFTEYKPSTQPTPKRKHWVKGSFLKISFGYDDCCGMCGTCGVRRPTESRPTMCGAHGIKRPAEGAKHFFSHVREKPA